MTDAGNGDRCSPGYSVGPRGACCPALGCAPRCDNGVKVDSNGCDTCQCADAGGSSKADASAGVGFAEAGVLACPGSNPAMQDIRYLAPGEVARLQDELLRMKLATWRYKHDPARERLGFIIDDNERSFAVDSSGDVVDLYGYTTLAVATVQAQAREIRDLKRELAGLRARVDRITRNR